MSEDTAQGPTLESIKETIERGLTELAAGTEDLDAVAAARVVADRLLSGGHVGRLGLVYDCPVARYLQTLTGISGKMTDPNGYLTVTRDMACVTLTAGAEPHEHACTTMPPAVRSFIERFDMDAYPELIEPKETAPEPTPSPAPEDGDES